MQCTGWPRCPGIQNLSGRGLRPKVLDTLKIYQIFMVPNAIAPRLSTTMQNIDTNWQTWQPAVGRAALAAHKESKLKLSLETRNRGDVIVVHCQGRIVYRDEAAALDRKSTRL